MLTRGGARRLLGYLGPLRRESSGWDHRRLGWLVGNQKHLRELRAAAQLLPCGAAQNNMLRRNTEQRDATQYDRLQQGSLVQPLRSESPIAVGYAVDSLRSRSAISWGTFGSGGRAQRLAGP